MVENYGKNSISLPGAIAMGTGVMIGAGIFALTGQIAKLAGPLFPLSFVVGAIVTAFSAYTYLKMSNTFPSAGGIGMIRRFDAKTNQFIDRPVENDRRFSIPG